MPRGHKPGVVFEHFGIVKALGQALGDLLGEFLTEAQIAQWRKEIGLAQK